MGLSMVEVLKIIRKEFKEMNMRIGIHTGNIIGGIIGTDIVRYDIYGRDVLIANKMESNGVPGRVMVSETTKNILERDPTNNYIFDFHKQVDFSLAQVNMSIKGYLVNEPMTP